MNPIQILVIDDSALMRELLRKIFQQDSGLRVVGAFGDPVAAQAALDRLAPDVITLDVEMPRMDGITFLEQLMRTKPLPVVMVSSLTERGCDVTLRALELGAVDFITKPKIDIARGVTEFGAELIAKVKTAARARLRRARVAVAHVGAKPFSVSQLSTTHKLVAIGASTGGTEALREVLTALPADAPPIVIVQHMPPVFTRQFAEGLDKQCRVRVKEARQGDVLLPGLVLVAPGGETHLEVDRSGAQYVVHLRNGPAVNHHRPSVDVLFQSCARHVGANAVGIVLTGMGSDGADGLLAMRRAGARTMAEHESTCVVYGMPKEAVLRGGAELVVPLDQVAASLLRLVRESAGSVGRLGVRGPGEKGKLSS